MKVWVTRDEKPGGELSTALTDAGLTAALEPVLVRRVVDDLSEAIAELNPDDWLVLTSVYAVESVAQDPARIPRVAVIGEKSRSAAKARGFRVELVSPDGDRKSLFDELRSLADGRRVLYARSSLAKPPEPWDGAHLHCPVLYETVACDFDPSVVDRVDVISVASPSAVESIRAAGFSLRGLSFASIGPRTSSALKEAGIEPCVEAPQRSFESLAKAIARYEIESRHHRA